MDYFTSAFDIAKQVRLRREQLNMTQAELGQATGLSRYTIMRFERDGESLSACDLFKILETLHLRVSVEPFDLTISPGM